MPAKYKSTRAFPLVINSWVSTCSKVGSAKLIPVFAQAARVKAPELIIKFLLDIKLTYFLPNLLSSDFFLFPISATLYIQLQDPIEH